MRKSRFLDVFGNYPVLRVLDFLMENEIFDYSRKDIATYSDVAWNTLQSFFDRLLDAELIVKTRRVGKSEMFKLNLDNPVVERLMEIDKKLMLESLDELEAEEDVVEIVA